MPTTTTTTPVRWSAVLGAEWLKLTSLRATWVTLGIGIGLAVAISALLAVVVGATWDEWDATDRADFDPVLYPLTGSIAIGIALVVVGVKIVANEYSSGMIRLTLTVTPRRSRVLLAKLAVVSGVTVVAGLIATLAMFLVGQAVFASYDLETAGLGDADVLRMILGTAATAPLLPVMGAACAFLLRSSAGAITAVLALVFAPSIVGAMLPDWWQRNVLAYLPGAAADSIGVGHLDTSTTYVDPVVGAVVTVAWFVLAGGAAQLALNRRDA